MGLAFITNVLSVVSTIKCLKGRTSNDPSRANVLSISEQRERTVYILALPAFYCLMCFLSCQQLLTYVLGTIDTHWAWDRTFKNDVEKETFTLDMITFYMSAANV